MTLGRATMEQSSEVTELAEDFLRFHAPTTQSLYRIDLRIFFEWCDRNELAVFTTKRRDLEEFAKEMTDVRGNSIASMRRRLGTIRSYYKLALADGYVDRNPVAYVRTERPEVRREQKLGLTHLEMAAMITAARESGPTDWALIVLMGMLGLRVSEACSLMIENTRITKNGHRCIEFLGKGRRHATMPVPPAVGLALDAASGDRECGPLLISPITKEQMSRGSARRIVERVARRAGIKIHVHPHLLRHGFITMCLDAGVPLRETQFAARHADPRMTMRYDRHQGNMDRHAAFSVAGFLADSGANGPMMNVFGSDNTGAFGR
jgi:integrase/recombinase XerD